MILYGQAVTQTPINGWLLPYCDVETFFSVCTDQNYPLYYYYCYIFSANSPFPDYCIHV